MTANRKILMMSLLSALAVGCVDTGAKPEADLGVASERIVGGSATTIEAHPHQVYLQARSFGCGGSVLSDRWVLTAAHCVDGQRASSLTVYAGLSRLSQASSAQRRSVARVIVYPGYTDPENGRDAALLELSSPLDLSGSRVKAIPIVTPSAAATGITDPDVVATVSGWGRLSDGGSSPDSLYAVQVPIVSNSAAQTAYRQTISSDQLAAGIIGTGGRDSCQGDSGGPLTVSTPNGRALAGIVSWGFGCADPRYPGMYGRVASFSDWIMSNATDVTAIDEGGSTPPPPPPPPTSSLDEQDLSAAQGTWLRFELTVPSGATEVTVTMSGGLGDADLYVRRGSAPSSSAYDCRPYKDGNAEQCVVSGVSGTVHVGVYAYRTFSDVDLTATFNGGTMPPPPPPPSTLLTQSNLGAAQGQWLDFEVTVPAGTTAVANLTGNNGDADLYIRYGTDPDLGTFDCRSWSNSSNEACSGLTAGTAHIGVYAYRAFSGATLTVAAE